MIDTRAATLMERSNAAGEALSTLLAAKTESLVKALGASAQASLKSLTAVWKASAQRLHRAVKKFSAISRRAPRHWMPAPKAERRTGRPNSPPK